MSKQDESYEQIELTCFAEGMSLGELEQVLRLLDLATTRTRTAIEHIRQGQRHAQLIGDYPYTHPSLRDAA